jgi:hypothetical protein
MYIEISVELLTLSIETFYLFKSRLSPVWLAGVHGFFTVAWLTEQATTYTMHNFGYSQPRRLYTRYH